MMDAEFSSELWSHDKRIEAAREVHFERLKGVTYLDHAGATLYSESHLRNLFHDLSSSVFGNPHSRSLSSVRSTEVVEEVRSRILHHFNVTSSEYAVIFTSNCTAALKLVGESFDFEGTVKLENGIDLENVLLSSVSEKPKFVYLADNHTSVIGLREIMKTRNVPFECLTKNDVNSFISFYPNVLPDDKYETRKIIPVNHLFAYPAQSNFSGQRYPLSWIQKIQGCSGFAGRHGNWYVLLDAASFLTASTLDLKQYKPDFVVMSFYKVFGFPTGLGALLVNVSSAAKLKKTYFGGGTINAALATEDFHVKNADLSHRFEDGTLPFLEILAVKHGFDSLLQLTGSLKMVSCHTFALAKYVHDQLVSWRHSNGSPLVVMYHSENSFASMATQGPIVNFNLLNSDGSYMGYAVVDKLAQLYNIHFRTGCFCNMGACAQHLGMTPKQVKDNLKAGHVCGDDINLIDGRPTGSIRLSFGYCSTFKDAEVFLQFIRKSFLEANENESLNVKANFSSSAEILLPDTEGTVERSLCSEAEEPTNNFSELKDEAMQLVGIHIYPVKSCGSLAVTQRRVGPRGLASDREWMVVNDNGAGISQKREPQMCCIKPTFDKDGCLTLSYPGFSSLRVSLHEPVNQFTSGQLCQGKVCGDRILGSDCGEEAAQWLQTILQKPYLRLVRQNMDDERTMNRNKTGEPLPGKLSLANEAQYLLLGTASVMLLLSHIRSRVEMGELKKEESCLDYDELVERFRANLIVRTHKPFEEEKWSMIRIGSHTFMSEGPCTRCQMVCVDQRTGCRTKEPLLSLVKMSGKKNTFGVLLRRVEDSADGCLSVGDVVEPLPVDGVI